MSEDLHKELKKAYNDMDTWKMRYTIAQQLLRKHGFNEEADYLGTDIFEGKPWREAFHEAKKKVGL